MDRIFDILIMILAAMFGAVALGGTAGFCFWCFAENRSRGKRNRKYGRKRK